MAQTEKKIKKPINLDPINRKTEEKKPKSKPKLKKEKTKKYQLPGGQFINVTPTVWKQMQKRRKAALKKSNKEFAKTTAKKSTDSTPIKKRKNVLTAMLDELTRGSKKTTSIKKRKNVLEAMLDELTGGSKKTTPVDTTKPDAPVAKNTVTEAKRDVSKFADMAKTKPAKRKAPKKKGRFGVGSAKTLNGKANVSKEQLDKTGLSLGEYMNKWKKDGSRPTAKDSTWAAKTREAVMGKSKVDEFADFPKDKWKPSEYQDEASGGVIGQSDMSAKRVTAPKKKKKKVPQYYKGGGAIKKKYAYGGRVAKYKG